MSLENYLTTATAMHRAGRFGDAREIYERLLRERPGNATVLHLLGVLCIDTGDYVRGEQLIRDALRINRTDPIFYVHYGLVLERMGRMEEALRAYRSATRQRPKYAEAYAAAGRISFELGRFDEALRAYEKAISARPNPDYLSDKSNIQLRIGQSELALSSAEAALRMQPRHESAMCNKALSLQSLGRLDEALIAIDEAIDLNPWLVQAHVNRSAINFDLGRFKDSVNDCRKVLSLDPGNVGAYVNMGTALFELCQPIEALSATEAALAINPASTAAMFNRAMAFRDLRRFEDSIAAFDALIKLDLSFEQAYWEKAVACLFALRFDDGWALYDRRKKKPLKTSKSRYDASASSENRLLVCGEQGIGDEIFFSATLAQIEGLSAKTIVQIDPRLVELLSRSFPSLTIIGADRHVSESEYDRYLQLGSVYGALRKRGLRHEDWRKMPYLIVDQTKVMQIRATLSRPGRRLCGISWRSQKAPYSDAKSMSLDDLRPVFNRPNTDFVSLQYGDVSSEIDEFTRRTGIEIKECAGVDNYADLDAHAALVEACDYVIVVSNTTAHVAGALAKAGCVALPYARGAFFYWALRDDGRVYWYPSLRGFIQSKDEEWADVMRRISEEMQ